MSDYIGCTFRFRDKSIDDHLHIVIGYYSDRQTLF